MDNGELPGRLQEIVEDFQFCQGREKLEYLLEFAQSLPPLPEWLEGKKDQMDEVHECMTPVFVYAENRQGQLTYHFDIPPESPTVRGFGEILRESTVGLTAEAVLQIPHDFYLQLGLQEVLTGQRLHGMSAMLRHMKQLAAPHVQPTT